MKLAAAALCAFRLAVRGRVRTWWSILPGWRVVGIAESPITGPEGNHEFLIGAVLG